MQISDSELARGDIDMEESRGFEDEDGEEEKVDVEDECDDLDDDDDLDEEEDGEDDDDSQSEESPPPVQPRLKIKLLVRPPAHHSSASNTASTPTRTPAPEDFSHNFRDIESEDEDDQDEHSVSTSLAGPSSRPMTTRQAVLASVVDSTHVSLSESSRKKKPLNEAEIALRREETARKRRNLSEKKLEDEKAETINRLLKKQSRPKNKRHALPPTDDRTPQPNATVRPVPTPASKSVAQTPNTEGEGDGEEDIDEEGYEGTVGGAVEADTVPIMYRWVSSSRGAGEKKMHLTFSVPVGLVVDPSMGRDDGMRVDSSHSASFEGKAVPRCDVKGCLEPRKYRVVKKWTLGACGMGHLKALEDG